MSFFFCVPLILSLGADQPQPISEFDKLGTPFQGYTTKDKFGRTINFYVSRPPRQEPGKKRPVALFIQGSGCQSLWRKQDDRVTGGYQNILLKDPCSAVRVLVVEKPGVKLFDRGARPGSAEGGSPEFLREHTLERWAEANCAALQAAWTLPGVDPSRALVIGHSEGGIAAARMAADLPKVTHVASLAGGGPTQLFSLVEAQSIPRAGDRPGDAERRAEAIYVEWDRIKTEPESTQRFWLGHPYRRWSSFLKYSVIGELARSKARIYLVQGTRDTSVPVTGHDVLVAELRAQGRDVTAERLEGADHGFRLPTMPQGSPDGMQAVFLRVLRWFMP